ncbi:metallophosphoesterase [Macromonas nakdongensis]|uniref:metallophosphoesterase n=1 Tax=Macromonas nakdongensis TaxID=1843082 RepID=UPI000C332CB9|nr:metallophosphoesterase [Macromonas nakdongensis]
MKLQLLSDLHLEANPGFEARPHPQAELLVLAGDIGSYQTRPDGSRMAEPDWGLRRFSPRAEHAAWPVPVLFVPGNHEYDGLDFDAVHAELRATCERLGILWLERETRVLGGVRFVGCTLWSDYDALADVPPKRKPAPGHEPDPLTRRLKQRDKALRAADFYLHKMQTQRNGQLFDAAAMREAGLHSQAWLRDALAQPFDGPTVVVTHFAPSLRSADPRYGLTPGTAGFCNALDDLLPQADLWLHGHLHCAHDYRVGRCRVVANPLGYVAKGEQQAFQDELLLQV